jgi:hypothetical protein
MALVIRRGNIDMLLPERRCQLWHRQLKIFHQERYYFLCVKVPQAIRNPRTKKVRRAASCSVSAVVSISALGASPAQRFKLN